MQSKKSYFNKTLFRKNLTRYWPLWGGLSLAGAFVPLYLILEVTTSSHGNLYITSGDFVELLYNAVTMFAPAFIMGYAIVCAMLIWNYLYSPRAVGLMHTLPVSRTCLFLTNTISGLTMMAIPFTIVGGLLSLIALFWGFFDLLAVANTVLAVILLAVLFFGLATLCAMLTGHIAVLPVLYLVVNFVAEVLEVLIDYINSLFLMGVVSANSGRLMFLSPVLKIYRNFRADNQYIYLDPTSDPPVRDWECHLEGLGMVALYGLVGIGLLALAWLLYRKRQSERAGDVVAYRPLRPVFRYGVALLSAVTLGVLLDSLFWEAVRFDETPSEFVPMVVCMAITGVLGYYIASMLLEKSLRVFRGSWKGVLIVCAGAVVLCGAMKLDIFGLEDKVPALDDIEDVFVYGSFNQSLDFDTDTEEGRKMMEQLLDIHRAIVADKDYIYSIAQEPVSVLPPDYEQRSTANFCLRYTLKDGSSLRRQYTLPIHETRLTDQNTYDGKINALLNSEPVRLLPVKIPDNGSLLKVNVYDSGYSVEGSGDDERLYQALLQDAKEGNLSDNLVSLTDYYTRNSDDLAIFNVWFEILYAEEKSDYQISTSYGDTKSSPYTSTGSLGVELNSRMENTIATLIDEGYFTEADIQAMLDGTYVPHYREEG